MGTRKRAWGHSRRRAPRDQRGQPSNAYSKNRFYFLCDNDTPVLICQEIDTIPGFSSRHVMRHGMAQTGDPGIFDEMMRKKERLITFDTDFLDHVKYPLGGHLGILVIHMSSEQPSFVAPRLRAFLRPPYIRKMKGGVVELQDSIAIIRKRNGEIEEFRYYQDR